MVKLLRFDLEASDSECSLMEEYHDEGSLVIYSDYKLLEDEVERLKLVAEKALKESKSIQEKSINTQWELDIRRRQEYNARYQNGGWR